MPDPKAIDGILVQWGDRLFYPGNRIARGRTPRLHGRSIAERAAVLRGRIAATVARRAPQVMVKVTGGGRGMKAIAAHLRYISRNGRIDIEDDQGNVSHGKDTLRELADDWRFGGSRIPDESPRREAFNITLSMPRGTDPLTVQRAAREFAKAELADHKYVMVLHDHQANPHVHLSVRAESKNGKRLNPRKADLHHWRETFAEKLRDWGIECQATRQAGCGRARPDVPLWRIKAAEDGRLRSSRPLGYRHPEPMAPRPEAAQAWREIARALGASTDKADRDLAGSITEYVRNLPAPVDRGLVR